MNNIKERITNIAPYFKEMHLTAMENENTIVVYIIVVFPRQWIIENNIEEKFGIKIVENGDNEFYFCGNLDDGIENIFDAIDYCIKKMREAIERARLLSEKTMQLKELFQNEDIQLSDLKKIKFDMPKKKNADKKVNLSDLQFNTPPINQDTENNNDDNSKEDIVNE